MNDDYESLRAKITNPNQQAFLDNYPKFKTIVETAQAIGITSSAVRQWHFVESNLAIETDKIFTNAFACLKKDIQEKLIADHEANIDNTAFDPKTPAQSRIFGSLVRLRAEAPDKYREKPLIDKAIIGDIVVKLSTPPYDDQLPQAVVEVKLLPQPVVEGEVT